MTSSTVEPHKRMLERTRPLDYVSLEGLFLQTGCNSSDLDIFALKELVDNALDACEGSNPTVEVKIETQSQFMTLTVKDNGKGLREDDIKKIIDFERAYSTKFHYKYPTRGALGNALKCVLGIPYALASASNVQLPPSPIRISSMNKEHLIDLDIKKIDGKVDSSISSKNARTVGTAFSVVLPIYQDDWGKKVAYYDYIKSYAIFNPNADIRLEIIHPSLSEPFSRNYPSSGKKSKRFSGASSIHWYTLSQFKNLIEAYNRSILRGEGDLTLREFIKQFRGLSAEKKITQVLGDIKTKGNIRYLSELADKGELIPKLYESMKKNSYKPTPDILGEIGKKQLLKRIRQIYGEPIKYKYKKVKGITEGGIPYILEIAIAVEDTNIGLRVHPGINHSPCLGNPYDGYHHTWTDEHNRKQEEVLLTGLLEKYEIDYQQPVVLIIHLICPNIEYKSYGKGKININPFINDLAKTLRDICRFYPRYKRRMKSGSDSYGRTTEARNRLRQELGRRLKLLKEYGEVPEVERTTQQGIYYKIRSQMNGKIDIKRDSFITALKEECISIGGDLSFREKLGIFAAERAQLFFRGKTYPVNWERIEDLATKGCDVLLIEKEGVCTVLEPYASRRGVALLNSRGFATEYAQQLVKLSTMLRGNLFILTDQDASGLLIPLKLPRIPRLGVDPTMISSLGLKQQDVEEKYSAPRKHLKALPQASQSLVKDKRIEIDAVLAAVGPEKLWNYLEQRMLQLAPQRDLTRSVDLTIKLPPEISRPLTKIKEFVQSVGAPRRNKIKEELRDWKEGFVNVEEKEMKIQSLIIEEIRKNNRIKELAKQLNNLADSISKNS